MNTKQSSDYSENEASSTQSSRPDDSELSILKGVAEGAPIDEILDRVVRRMEERLPGAICCLLRLDPATGKLRHVAGPNFTESYAEEVGEMIPGPRARAWGAVQASAAALKQGFRACWSVPILSVENELLGTIVVYHTEPRECSRADLAGMESTLHLASLGMQHSSYRQELEARNRLIKGAAEAMQILVSENDISVALSRVLSIIGEAAEVDRVYFFEYHEHPETGEPVASQRAEWVRGEIESQLDHAGMQNFQMADLFPDLDAALRRGEAGAGMVNGLTGQAREFLVEQDIRSFLLVPVVLDSVWGFMGFDDCRQDRTWNQAERAVLQSTASALGAAFVRAEDNRALVIANERFERVAANVPGVVFQCVIASDGTPTFTYVSEGGSHTFGRDPKVLLKQPDLLNTLLHPEDRGSFWKSIFDAIANEDEWDWEGRSSDEAGEIHWISAVGNHVVQEDGSTLWHGLFMDVTEHREGQRALELSEQRLSALFENALDAILLADDNARYIDANPAACNLLGYTREELLSLNISDLVSPLAAEEALIGWKIFIEIGSLEGEFELVRSDGSTVVVEYSARASILPGLHLSIMRDVTLRMQAEDALIESEAMFRKLAETAPVMIWTTDANREVTYLSEQWAQFTGRAMEGELGYGWMKSLHPEDRRGTEASSSVAFEARGLYETEYRLQRADGEYRWMAARGVPRFGSNGAFLGYIGTTMEIHDRKLHVQELIKARLRAEEAARLKTVLLTNMSHEIRTPLTAIMGFADILAEEVDQHHAELVSHVRIGAERLFETLNSVLDYAQLEAGDAQIKLGAVDLNVVVAESISFFGTRAEAKGLKLRTDLPSNRVIAFASQSALSRVVSNLVSNAIKFTDVGHVEVGARIVDDAIELWVSDTGRGISRAFLPNLYVAFLQESEGTMRDFEGCGLGLAITNKLVHAMGATIEVESDEATGSTFTVRMPRFDPALRL